MLLFRALDRYGLDAHDDQDTEGDHKFLKAIATPVLDKDEEYRSAVAQLIEKADQVPKGIAARDWLRELNHEHLGEIMRALKKHGYLDRAPVPESNTGEDFL